MRVKKSTAWIVGLLTLVGMYVTTALTAPDQLQHVGPTIIGSITAATIGYFGANVADNGVKGAYYRPELDKEK